MTEPNTPAPAPSNLVTKNPNASISGGTALLATGVVWLVGNVFHVALSAEAGAAIAGVVSTGTLWFGRHGLYGLWDIVKHGTGRKP